MQNLLILVTEAFFRTLQLIVGLALMKSNRVQGVQEKLYFQFTATHSLHVRGQLILSYLSVQQLLLAGQFLSNQWQDSASGRVVAKY